MCPARFGTHKTLLLRLRRNCQVTEEEDETNHSNAMKQKQLETNKQTKEWINLTNHKKYIYILIENMMMMLSERLLGKSMRVYVCA